jgi:hypothetical protein
VNTVKLVDIQEAIHNALHATFDMYKNITDETRLALPYFQDRFEKQHNCQIIKSYSQKQTFQSTVSDIKYWHSLQFKNSHDITMFILRWT